MPKNTRPRRLGKSQRKRNRRRPLRLERLEPRHLLATYTVNSTADAVDAAIDGTCDDGSGVCTLRAAVQEANASAGVPDTIDFSIPTATYTLSIGGTGEDAAASGDLDITDSLTILGNGPADTVIDAAMLDRVFHIPFGPPDPTFAVSFQDITVTNGLATDSPGGALTEAAGGGIANVRPGALISISDSVITQNSADGTVAGLAGQGGGLADAGGNLTISNTEFSNNQATGNVGESGQGGGFFALNSTGLLINSVVSSNTATGGNGMDNPVPLPPVAPGSAEGGGIYTSGGNWTMVGSVTIDGNTAVAGDGVVSSGFPVFFPGADASGGGIYTLNGTWSMTLTPGSTISRNQAIAGDGGAGTSALPDGSDGGQALGGGLAVAGTATWDMLNDTVSGNDAVGGDGGAPLGGGLTGDGGDALGGGIYFAGTTMSVEHITVADNDATGGSGTAAGSGQGGGLFLNSGTFNLKSTIVADNTASTVDPDMSGAMTGPFVGPFTTEDYNLFENPGNADFIFMGSPFTLGPNDKTGMDPMLDPLQNNGGPTETHALQMFSPAIDMADPVVFPPFDQRGVSRPQDGDLDLTAISDIGAFELTVAAGEPGIDIEKFTNGFDADSPTGPLIAAGDTATFTYVVANAGDFPLENVTVTDSVLGAVTNIIADGNGDSTLDVNETWTFQASATVTPGQYMNTGTATADFMLVQVEDSDDSHHFGVVVGVDIEKTTNDEDADTPTGPVLLVGETAGFDYYVTNTGNVPLENVAVTDDQGVTVTFVDGDNELDVDETWHYTGSTTVTAGQYMNTGEVVADDATDTVPGQVSDTDPSHHFGADPAIDIEKATNGQDADAPAGPVLAVGSTANFTYVVTNAGNVPLSNIVVTDDQGVTVTFDSGDTNNDNILDLDETWTYTGSTTVTAGQYMNTGTATGDFTDDAGNFVQVEDSDASHHFGGAPEIDIEKFTNGENADEPDDPNMPAVEPGETVTWTYEVSNPGDVELSNVVVTDDNGTPGDTGDDFNPSPVLAGGFNVGDTDMDGLLDPGEIWQYEASAPAEDLSVTIDFETDGDGNALSAGTFIDDEYDNYGLTVSTDTTYGAMIFDSGNPTGEDTDLQTPGYGPGNNTALNNVLIISEDGDQSDPDDNAAGGRLIFEWDVPVTVTEIHVLDIDTNETTGTVTTYDDLNNVIGVHALQPLGDNSFQAVAVGDDFVSRMEVFFPASGAVTQIEFSGVYENIATATANGVSDTDASHYRNGTEQNGGAKRFYVVDRNDKNYSYNPDGSLAGVTPLATSNNYPRGAAMIADGSTVWVVDKYSGVWVYDDDGNQLGNWTPGGVYRPQGIATDGEDIWIIDTYYDKVFFYDGAASRLAGSQAATSSFSLVNGHTNPTGITTDGATLWTTHDADGADYVVTYNTAGTFTGYWRIDSDNVAPRGITINPGDVNHIWIVDTCKDKVYEYQGGAFFASGTSHSADATFNLAYYNKYPEGIADPPTTGLSDEQGQTLVPQPTTDARPALSETRLLPVARTQRPTPAHTKRLNVIPPMASAPPLSPRSVDHLMSAVEEYGAPPDALEAVDGLPADGADAEGFADNPLLSGLEAVLGDPKLDFFN